MKKKLIKKLTALVLAGLMAFSFAGCAGNQSKNAKENSNTSSASSSATNADRKIKVVCTTYPQYDWVRQIIGDKKDDYELVLLLDNGVDLHSYQPTTEDIVQAGSADLFIYVGGESDGWVDDVLKQKTNPDLKTVNLLDAIGEAVKEEEVKEGMQAEEEEEEGEEEEVEYDEHVWLSLKNASVLVNVIASDLEEIDPKNKEALEKNAAAYIMEIDQLDAKYEDVVKNASKKAVVFGDRFPFRYLVDDYGIDYYAAFVGCSAESEASFETVAFLSKKVDELGLKSVLVIESSDEKIAKSVIANTKDKDMKILKMDSLQSVTKDELNGEKSYLGIMTSNLSVLEEALN